MHIIFADTKITPSHPPPKQTNKQTEKKRREREKKERNEKKKDIKNCTSLNKLKTIISLIRVVELLFYKIREWLLKSLASWFVLLPFLKKMLKS